METERSDSGAIKLHMQNQFDSSNSRKSVGRRRFIAWIGAGLAFALVNGYILVRGLLPRWEVPVEAVIGGPFPPHSFVPVDAPDNSIVEPASVLIRQYPDNELALQVEFSFKGEISKSNRIELTVVAIDGAGRSVGNRSVICRDKRAWITPPGNLGGVKVHSDAVNRPNIVVPLPPRTIVSRVKLLFKRV